MADNYVIREKYNGLTVVDGQVIPQRGDVLPEELVETRPDDEGAHNNGGGTEPKRRRRRNTIDDEE
jgi:hypothetical protein